MGSSIFITHMRHLSILSAIAAALLLSSCSQVIYVPLQADKVHAPALSEKNEAKLDVSIGSNKTVAAQGSYSPIKHLGVTAAYSNFTYDQNTSAGINNVIVGSDRNYFNGWRLDLGAGFYTKFDEKGRFEVYGGFGSGHLKGRYVNYEANPMETTITTTYNMDITRVFAQVAAGTEGDVFGLMMGVKLGANNYRNISVNYNNTESPMIVADGPTFVQPFVDMRIGYKYVKFTTQLGLTYSTTSVIQGNSWQNAVIPLKPMPYITAGLVLNFAPRDWNLSSN